MSAVAGGPRPSPLVLRSRPCDPSQLGALRQGPCCERSDVFPVGLARCVGRPVAAELRGDSCRGPAPRTF
eukprot:10074258-Alexandrium_andersonii.AAC.1